MLLICEDSEVAFKNRLVLSYSIFMCTWLVSNSPFSTAADQSMCLLQGAMLQNHLDGSVGAFANFPTNFKGWKMMHRNASKCLTNAYSCFHGNVPFHIQILTYTLQGVTVVTATKNAEINELVHRNTQPRQMMLGTEMKDHVISLSQHSQQQSESLKAWSIRQSLLKGQLQVHLKEDHSNEGTLDYSIFPLWIPTFETLETCFSWRLQMLRTSRIVFFCDSAAIRFLRITMEDKTQGPWTVWKWFNDKAIKWSKDVERAQLVAW